MKRKITTGLTLGLFVVACSETQPIRNNITKNQTSNNSKMVHVNPILVSLDDLEKEDYSDVLAVEDGIAILLSDKNSAYDSAVSQRNRNISATGNGTVTINATGKSLLSQRIEYDTKTGEITSYRQYEYDPVTNAITKRTLYNTFGADKIWLNADDGIKDYSTFDVLMGTVQTSSIKFIGAGTDTTWFTEDDLVESYEAELLAADATPIGVALYNAAGVDKAWFTADDVIGTLTEDIIASDGSEHWAMFTDAGADTDWATLDDNTVGSFASTFFNADKLETKHIFFSDVGVDLKPFTTDDIPQFYHTYTQNAAKLESNKVRYNGPGVDTVWLTKDDDIEECEETSFSAENAIILEVDTQVGADELCFSGDDIIVDYNNFTYDATGHLTDEQVFSDPGPDTTWQTKDDLLKREYIFTPL